MADEIEKALEGFAWDAPAILLVDLDAFFASVEQLDHPSWRGKPVIVGGDPRKRGVVSTASYEARKYGVHSAMPSSTAARLCPEAIWTEGHFGRYRELSKKVMDILFDETPHVQQVSIDEAFMDVSPTKINREHPVAIAQRIRSRVAELGITCSIGVGTTKSIAKLASDMDKPNGLTVVLPGSESNFLAPLPVGSLSGIGPATQAKLKEMGIETLGQLAQADDDSIVRAFGKNGRTMLDRSRGLEFAEVDPDDDVVSISNETSFADDLFARKDIEAAIDTMAAKVGRRLRRKALKGKTLGLKVRYSNLKIRTVQTQLSSPDDDEHVFIPLLHTMLDNVWSQGMGLRLVGVSVTGFSDEERDQMAFDSLFKDELAQEETSKKLKNLNAATDAVREKFGDKILSFGKEMRTNANTTGSSSKSPADYK